MPTVEYALCIYIYLLIGLSGFTVQSTIVYRVNLFAMSGMQCVIYVKSLKVLAATIVYSQTLDEAITYSPVVSSTSR